MKNYFMKAHCHELSKGFSHTFQETTYFTPTFCDHCAGMVRNAFIIKLYRAYSLTCPAAMQIYWNERKSLHVRKKRVELPQDWFGTPTWLPCHSFGTPIWLPWRHVHAFHSQEHEESACFFCRHLANCSLIRRFFLRLSFLSSFPSILPSFPTSSLLPSYTLPNFLTSCFF